MDYQKHVRPLVTSAETASGKICSLKNECTLTSTLIFINKRAIHQNLYIDLPEMVIAYLEDQISIITSAKTLQNHTLTCNSFPSEVFPKFKKKKK